MASTLLKPGTVGKLNTKKVPADMAAILALTIFCISSIFFTAPLSSFGFNNKKICPADGLFDAVKKL
ncbi:hypothetical protein D3C85_840410 [compost metagenome]